MKVLLIVPPLYRFAHTQWNVFHLGLGYLAAALHAAGFDATIYDANISFDKPKEKVELHELSEKFIEGVYDAEHFVWKEVESVIRAVSPDIVGISSKIPDILSTLAVARLSKMINSNCITVVGGPTGTTCPDLVLQEPSVDFIVRGEEEETIVELLRTIQSSEHNLRVIDGLSFREGHDIIHNNPRALIENIDTIPFPYRNSLMFIDKLSYTARRKLMGHLITSRGCPYECSYCANNTVWGSRLLRMRNPESVLEEVIYLRDTYGVDRMIFWDDHLTTNRKRTVELCNLLIERKANIEWLSYARANTIDIELLRLMKKAGCYELQIGVESGSDRILKMINKGVTLDQIKSAAEMLGKAGLQWHCFLMIGFPTETAEEMRATIQLISELRPSSVELSVVTPYPGTKMFSDAVASGKISQSDWLKADTYKTDSVLVDTMPPDAFGELVRRYRWECNEYNSSNSVPPNLYYRAKQFLRKGLIHTFRSE